MYIIDDIPEERIIELKKYNECLIEDIVKYAPEFLVKEVMKQIEEIVASDNFLDLDISIYELSEMAINDVKRMKESTLSVDMGEINRENAKANLPSSMR